MSFLNKREKKTSNEHPMCQSLNIFYMSAVLDNLCIEIHQRTHSENFIVQISNIDDCTDIYFSVETTKKIWKTVTRVHRCKWVG